MLDLDHFKLLNDTHGHAAGDAALIAVAGLLERGCREADLVARWGGEEFVVLMPDARLAQARRTGMRLLEAIRAVRIEHGGQHLQLSASIGVAERGTHANLDALIDEADHWMYEAKRVGRGCVCCDETTLSADVKAE